MAKKKITVSVSEELYNWCSVQSETYGMSIPSLFVVAMAQYKDQTTVLSQMPTMIQLIQQGLNFQPKEQNNLIGCSCHECGVEVPKGVLNHFTAEDGRILCDKCSKGIKPINERMKAMLIDMESGIK